MFLHAGVEKQLARFPRPFAEWLTQAIQGLAANPRPAQMMPSNEEVVRKGKAMAAAFRGLQALDSVDVEISATERRLRSQLIRDYQQQLRAIIADALPEAAAEILSAGLPDLRLSANEPGVN